MDSLFSLRGKVIVITGGFGLLGSAMASACKQQGAEVAIVDLPSNLSEKNFYPCDITSAAAVAETLKALLKDLGKIDILVNNAYPRNQKWGTRFEEIPLESWNENVNSHLGGYFNITQQVSREMVRQGHGHIINICSIYGMVGPDFSIYDGTSMTMPAEYAAIKGGLINFTRYLATYLGKHQIRVNSISPGGIENGQDPKFIEKYAKKVPLGRMGKPEDIVGTLIFLASDASSYITGQNIAVDGGWTAW